MINLLSKAMDKAKEKVSNLMEYGIAKDRKRNESTRLVCNGRLNFIGVILLFTGGVSLWKTKHRDVTVINRYWHPLVILLMVISFTVYCVAAIGELLVEIKGEYKRDESERKYLTERITLKSYINDDDFKI